MARRKRNSTTLAHAKRRIESLQSINSMLDFGNGLTLEAYASLINELRSKLAAYNTALSSINKLADDVNTVEQAVLEISENMLLGVGSRYGRTSQEYEMAGGSRRRNSRRSSKCPDADQCLTHFAYTSLIDGDRSSLAVLAALAITRSPLPPHL